VRGGGRAATDPVAMDLAEELRRHTDRWFHDCGYEVHRELWALVLTCRSAMRLVLMVDCRRVITRPVMAGW